MTAGAFEIHGHDDNFDLRPKDVAHPIPDDQRKLSQEVYEAVNILKLLKAQGVFGSDDKAHHKTHDKSFEEFVARILQAAHAGCVAQHVDANLAAAALEQIRADILRRKGRALVYRYLAALSLWALAGGLVGVAIVAATCLLHPAWQGYGWVIIGAMAGTWLSVAATRLEVSFAGIQDYLDLWYEPFVRMLFVGLLATLFALFLKLKILSLLIGVLDLSEFADDHIGAALALGAISGIAEKAISVELIERARRLLAPEKT
jgi:hypothetical protein